MLVREFRGPQVSQTELEAPVAAPVGAEAVHDVVSLALLDVVADEPIGSGARACERDRGPGDAVVAQAEAQVLAVFADRLHVRDFDVSTEKDRLWVRASEWGELREHTDELAVHVAQVESRID